MKSRQDGRFPGTEVLPAMVLLCALYTGVICGIEKYTSHRLRMETDPVYRSKILEEQSHEREELSKLSREFVEGYRDKMVPWKNWFK